MTNAPPRATNIDTRPHSSNGFFWSPKDPFASLLVRVLVTRLEASLFQSLLAIDEPPSSKDKVKSLEFIALLRWPRFNPVLGFSRLRDEISLLLTISKAEEEALQDQEDENARWVNYFRSP